MIKYTLKCSDCQESYEAWFKSSNDYDDQKEKNLVTCPMCNSLRVDKALMSPQIQTSEFKTSVKEELLRIKKHVEKNFEYIEDGFADEAIAIIEGEKEPRDIYGKITKEDEEKMEEAGVPYVKVPWVTEDS